MLKHVVMWKLKKTAEGKSKAENALWMKEHLEALIGIIPEIKSLEVGINVLESDMAYDAVLISTFENKEALASYKVNPKHVEISSYCKKIRESRVVIDYYV
nr:Dabb family protein [uncultured Bacteroides sp.]